MDIELTDDEIALELGRGRLRELRLERRLRELEQTEPVKLRVVYGEPFYPHLELVQEGPAGA